MEMCLCFGGFFVCLHHQCLRSMSWLCARVSEAASNFRRSCKIRPNWGLVQKEARHSRWKRSTPRGWSQLEHAVAASEATLGSLWRLGQENRLVTVAFDFGMVVALEDSSSRQICHTMHLSHFQETLVFAIFAITLWVVHEQIRLRFLRHCLDATDIVQQYKVAHRVQGPKLWQRTESR
jgi:hypothetical protein